MYGVYVRRTCTPHMCDDCVRRTCALFSACLKQRTCIRRTCGMNVYTMIHVRRTPIRRTCMAYMYHSVNTLLVVVKEGRSFSQSLRVQHMYVPLFRCLKFTHTQNIFRHVKGDRPLRPSVGIRRLKKCMMKFLTSTSEMNYNVSSTKRLAPVI